MIGKWSMRTFGELCEGILMNGFVIQLLGCQCYYRWEIMERLEMVVR